MERYVSNIITEEVVEKLEVGKNYLIASEMGSGKSRWVREVLIPHNIKNHKRTLVLTHRIPSKTQQIEELERYGSEMVNNQHGTMFDYMSYQHFENMVKNDNTFIYSYSCIIADEAHYFVFDSSFNPNTELVFNFLNDNNQILKVFMTGTPDCLEYLPWKKKLIKIMEPNYANNKVKDLYRYEEDDTVISIVQNEVNQGRKVLAFHNSKETMDIFDGIGNSTILHAGNRERSLEFDQIATNQKFECDILNTTKLMTEATEIKDELVQTIVIHGISEIDTFVQATGRVRNQEVNVYYKKISKKSIIKRLNYFEEQLHYFDDYNSLGEIEFVKKYGIEVIDKRMKAFYLDTRIDSTDLQERTHLVKHKTGLAYLKYQYNMYEYMNRYGFEKFFETYFPNIQYYDIEELKRQGNIKWDIIEKFIDKKLFKEGQQELIDLLSRKYGLRAKNGSKNFGYHTINEFFERKNLPFVIIPGNRDSERNRESYWILTYK